MGVVSTQSVVRVQLGVQDGQPLVPAKPIFHLRAPNRRDDIDVCADAMRDGGRPVANIERCQIIRAALATLEEDPDVRTQAEGILDAWEQRERETSPEDPELAAQWVAAGEALIVQVAMLQGWAVDHVDAYRALDARAVTYHHFFKERWVRRCLMDWEGMPGPCERRGSYVSMASMTHLSAADVSALYERVMALHVVTPEEKKDLSAA